MSTPTVRGLGQFGVGLLVKKLDMAMQTLAKAKADTRLSEEEIDAAHELEGHVLVYAGLIADIQAKRVNEKDPGVVKLLDLVEEFCSVVSSTFNMSAPAGRAIAK
jgi:hypothetical protein